MPVPAIEIKGLWKEYSIGGREHRPDSFREMLSGAFSAPFRALTGRDREAPEERFWALKDINLEVQRGEVVGIIGRNGAGKSTLLKILSRITEPTKGEISIRGRVASLLEVGTGFHPELTGRENIYLNGAILGMSRAEIGRKFDEIVAFAEIEKFLDTPVKRYSSGMYVRLAFAVAAHLDVDILIVDEVLAVGDLRFQRKCLGQMEQVAKHGRTVLLVSHNLTSIRHLCRSVAVMDGGRQVYVGPINEGVDLYERSQAENTRSAPQFHGPLTDRIRFEKVTAIQGGKVVEIIDPLQPIDIEVQGVASKGFSVLDVNISVLRDGVLLEHCHDAPRGDGLPAGPFRSHYRLPAGALKPGRFTISVGATTGTEWISGLEALVLDVSESWSSDSAARDGGIVSLRYTAKRLPGAL